MLRCCVVTVVIDVRCCVVTMVKDEVESSMQDGCIVVVRNH